MWHCQKQVLANECHLKENIEYINLIMCLVEGVDDFGLRRTDVMSFTEPKSCERLEIVELHLSNVNLSRGI